MKKFLKNYWAFLIPLLILIITGIFLLTSKKGAAKKSVPIVGIVEAEFIDISASLPGRLSTVNVNPNQLVKEGEILAVMEADEIMNIQRQAASMVSIAMNHQSIVEEGVSPEMIQSAENLQSIAQEQVDLMTKTYNRFENLYSEGAISGQERDVIYFRYKAAEKELETAKLNVQRLKSGSKSQRKDSAGEVVDQAKEAEKLTEQIKEKSNIKAPADGIISTLISKPGEMINAGYPIMTLQKTNSVYLSFNIRQDKMSGIEEGQRAQVRVPGAVPEVFDVEVTELAAALGYADYVPESGKGEFDLRTFKIKLVPVNPENIKGLRPGMTAELILD